MTPKLQRLVQRIDALTLRERAIAFVTAAFALIFLVDTYLIEPQFRKQKQFSQQIQQDQVQIAALQEIIQHTIKANSIDPDADNLLRLQTLKQQYRQMQGNLLEMQKGLIPSDKMVGVLEDILKRNGRLRLLTLKTLPVSSLNQAADQPASGNKGQVTGSPVASSEVKAAQTEALIYRHGVELTMQGNYLDMVQYMTALESMPWQLFWGKAILNVDEHPQATLTLTLYTLSLDKKWLNL